MLLGHGILTVAYPSTIYGKKGKIGTAERKNIPCLKSINKPELTLKWVLPQVRGWSTGLATLSL
jgi:hypothetical protein